VETSYDLAETRRCIDELYPVLLDAHGNLIDGNNRLDVSPSWRTETRMNIKTRSQLWLARIVANSCRRVVTREERAIQFTELARSLLEEGLTRMELVSTIAKLTTFSERYVRMLLPDEYKRGYTAPDNSELSSEYELSEEGSTEALEPDKSEPSSEYQVSDDGFTEALEKLGVTVPNTQGIPAPRISRQRLPQLLDGAPVQPEVTVPTVSRHDAAVAQDADMQSGTPEPRTSLEDVAPGTPIGALDHIRGFFDMHPEPDEEYLVWEVAIKHGVPTEKGWELVEQVKRELGIKDEKPHDSLGEVRCPLCCREGASRGEILGLVRDPSVGQLKLWEFVMEEMG